MPRLRIAGSALLLAAAGAVVSWSLTPDFFGLPGRRPPSPWTEAVADLAPPGVGVDGTAPPGRGPSGCPPPYSHPGALVAPPRGAPQGVSRVFSGTARSGVGPRGGSPPVPLPEAIAI